MDGYITCVMCVANNYCALSGASLVCCVYSMARVYTLLIPKLCARVLCNSAGTQCLKFIYYTIVMYMQQWYMDTYLHVPCDTYVTEILTNN